MSLQNVSWGHRGAKGAGRGVTDPLETVNATVRTGRDFACAVQLDVVRQVVWEVDGSAIGFVLFKRELVHGGLNLPEVVDARIA